MKKTPVQSKTVWLGWVTTAIGLLTFITPTLSGDVAKFALTALGILQVVQRVWTIKKGG